MTYVQVGNLPECLQAPLRGIYGKTKDIELRPTTQWSPQMAADKGCRAVVSLVNLTTGEVQSHQGSWGGANPWNQDNAIDLDGRLRPLPPGFAVIKASTGYRKYAYIELHPDNVAPLLPAAKGELSEKDRKILACYKSLKSGYRREYLDRLGATDTDLDRLVEGGYLKRNKNGATRITTEGRNNAAPNYY